MSLLSEMKRKLRHAVETLYEFNPNQTARNMSYNVARAKELLTKMAFIYRVHLYCHTILSALIHAHRTTVLVGTVINTPSSKRPLISYGSRTKTMMA
jgi:hypothetical protein